MAQIDLSGFARMLGVVVSHYEKSAPTVAAWANDLYVRLTTGPGDDVAVSELTMVNTLHGCHGESWMHPNVAANAVYKLMHRLGRDTTGHAGF